MLITQRFPPYFLRFCPSLNPEPCDFHSPFRACTKPGKFVSESKFLSDPAAFVPHIQTPNREALDALITKPEVEKRLLQRLRRKATVYAQDLAADGSPNQDGVGKIDVDGVVELYEHYIIPLTKEVEVRLSFSEIAFLLADGLTDRLTTCCSVSMGYLLSRSRSSSLPSDNLRFFACRNLGVRRLFHIVGSGFPPHGQCTESFLFLLTFPSVEAPRAV